MSWIQCPMLSMLQWETYGLHLTRSWPTGWRLLLSLSAPSSFFILSEPLCNSRCISMESFCPPSLLRTYYNKVGKCQECAQSEYLRHSLRQCGVQGQQALGRCGCRRLLSGSEDRRGMNGMLWRGKCVRPDAWREYLKSGAVP